MAALITYTVNVWNSTSGSNVSTQVYIDGQPFGNGIAIDEPVNTYGLLNSDSFGSLYHQAFIRSISIGR